MAKLHIEEGKIYVLVELNLHKMENTEKQLLRQQNKTLKEANDILKSLISLK